MRRRKGEEDRALALLSVYARRKKVRHFIEPIAKEYRVLEVGCGAGWLGKYMRAGGWQGYVGLDLEPPADVVGDIRDWHELGLKPASFDVIVAFEVVEHVDCFQAMYDLLKPGGELLLTSPAPQWDWACLALETLGLAQRRTSPHDHLIDFHEVPLFEPVELRRVGMLSQWARFRKPDNGAPA